MTIHYTSAKYITICEATLERFDEALQLKYSEDPERFAALDRLAQKQLKDHLTDALTKGKFPPRGTVDNRSLLGMRFYVVFKYQGNDRPISALAVCSFQTVEQRLRSK